MRFALLLLVVQSSLGATPSWQERAHQDFLAGHAPSDAEFAPGRIWDCASSQLATPRAARFFFNGGNVNQQQFMGNFAHEPVQYTPYNAFVFLRTSSSVTTRYRGDWDGRFRAAELRIALSGDLIVQAAVEPDPEFGLPGEAPTYTRCAKSSLRDEVEPRQWTDPLSGDTWIKGPSHASQEQAKRFCKASGKKLPSPGQLERAYGRGISLPVLNRGVWSARAGTYLDIPTRDLLLASSGRNLGTLCVREK